MKVFVLIAEHFSVPPVIVSVHADQASAEAKAAELVNIMLKDSDDSRTVTAETWPEALNDLQEEHGAAHCYVDLLEREVIGALDEDEALAVLMVGTPKG